MLLDQLDFYSVCLIALRVIDCEVIALVAIGLVPRIVFQRLLLALLLEIHDFVVDEPFVSGSQLLGEELLIHSPLVRIQLIVVQFIEIQIVEVLVLEVDFEWLLQLIFVRLSLVLLFLV